MAYNQRGMLQAVIARFTRIDLRGAPIPGLQNRFTTDALISVSYTMAYNKQDDITILNGAGIACTTYSPPQTLLRLDIGDINFCYPDPEAIEIAAGGVVFTGTPAVVGDEVPAIGYAAPPVGRDPKPAGVAMELWASQVEEGAIVGYVQWLMPRTKLQFTKDQQLNGTDPYNTGMEGISLQNSGWGTGVADEYADWPVTNRVYQWQQIDELPEYEYGYSEVPVPV